MAVTVVVAADIAIVRAAWVRSEWLAFVAIGLLPMLNLLAWAFPRACRPGEHRPFWIGFVAGGGAATLALARFWRIQGDSEVVFMPTALLASRLARFDGLPQLARVVLVHAALYTGLLLVPAWTVGRLARQSQIQPRIERRSIRRPR